MVAAGEPSCLDLLGSQSAGCTSVWRQRPLPVGRDQRADDACFPFCRTEYAHASLVEVLRRELPGEIRASLPEKCRFRPELRRPGRDVGRLTSRREADLCLRVPPLGERAGKPHRNVERKVAEGADTHGGNRKISVMDGEKKRRGVRSFVLGGLVGASAVAATLNRRRRIQRGRGRPRGLAAFESAPCYLELLEAEREREQSAP